MAKQVSEAKILIDSLLAQGVKKSEIAKKLGIDSSTISQVEKGKKPGRNLIEPLRAIAENRESIPPREVRKTKSGEPAKVRTKKKESVSKSQKVKKDSKDRIKIAEETVSASAAVQRLEKIAGDGGKVTLLLRYSDGSRRRLFDRGGEFAERLAVEYRRSEMRFFDWLTEKAAGQFEVQNYGSMVDSGSVVAVGYLAIYTAAGGEA